jgi:hypothetical protein
VVKRNGLALLTRPNSYVAFILSKIPGKIFKASTINYLKDAGVVITISQKCKDRKIGS